MPCITCWIDGGEAIWAARDVVEEISSGASTQGWLVIFSPMPTTMTPVDGCSMRRPASLRSAQRRSFGHLKRASGRPSERAYSKPPRAGKIRPRANGEERLEVRRIAKAHLGPKQNSCRSVRAPAIGCQHTRHATAVMSGRYHWWSLPWRSGGYSRICRSASSMLPFR